jgi:hypothetical protein
LVFDSDSVKSLVVYIEVQTTLGFLTKITGAAIGEELTLINPLSKCLFKYFHSTCSSFWDILYKNPNPKSFFSLIMILWLYSPRFSSLLTSFYKNDIRCLWYFINTFVAGLVYFFGAKAFLISAIVTAKISCLCFLASHTSGVAPMI